MGSRLGKLKREKMAPLSRNTGDKILEKEILKPKKGDRRAKIEKER